MLLRTSTIFFRRFSGTGKKCCAVPLSTPSLIEQEENCKSVLDRPVISLAPDPKMAEKILESDDYFNVHNIFTVKNMFDARAHYGHKVESLNPKMGRFVFGERLGQVIFDLDITAYHLRKALNICAHVAYRDGIILFVSHNKRCSVMVEKTAIQCKEFAVTKNWVAGVFIKPLNIIGIDIRLPDLCILMNTKYETGQRHGAVIECCKTLVPTIAIVDSDCDPNLITYPIPANDDTPSSIEFFCNVFKEAIMRGKKAKLEHLSKANLLKETK